uniref:Cps4B n=1 Tax=Actinobacillus pleuropneumoniae serovar 4 str. M62 TaxID=754255 RepID=F4YBG0_ACTPL|nr:Cps4B [Actinobacillus pleuropneumoniae serovar 4 str. M62]
MNKVKRKFRKLLRDPKLFFSDFWFKHSIKLEKFLSIKHYGNNEFTIVSAIYNVEKYLDQYFNSIFKQTLLFKNNINIICVDDGSTDKSAEIIEKYRKKYPQNIKYIYKENGGQASARNLGIKYVTTKWVTFIDPDDFISRNYFELVDDFIEKNTNLSLVSCPFIFYFEDKNIYKDRHPLNFRFKNGEYISPIKSLDKHIQLSVNSAFFRTAVIKKNNIQFGEIRPNFEDAKFVGDYLLSVNQENLIGFMKDVSYFYRKRSDQSSTLDTAWKNPLLYSQVLENGCLALCERSATQKGFVPKYIQRAVLYHLSWYFKYLINNKDKLNFLTDKEQTYFLELLHKIFRYIDVQTIMDFELAGTWFFQRVAWLGYFKKVEPDFQIVYIDSIDRENKQILFYYYTFSDMPNEEFYLGKNELEPIDSKLRSFDFMGNNFVYERRIWLPYSDKDKKLLFRFKINGQEPRISLAGKQHKSGLPIHTFLRDMPVKKYTHIEDFWIIMDRDVQADDNGEHFYRYMMNNHPEQKIYFAINRNSNDWGRLKREGFNLIDFKSNEFKTLVSQCSRLISSHIDEYIINPFKDHFEFTKKFIFLQHGVTHNDLSDWLNSKKILSCIITATPDEYNHISENKSRYKYSTKEAILTGFPRHDALLRGNKTETRTILIMPTWRNSILGKNAKGNERSINSEFMNTQYAKAWGAILSSPILEKLANQYDFEVIFAPHKNIEPYLDLFNIPKYIKQWKASEGNIQKLFQNSKFMITDYSSVAFEMGYLNKTVLYYQFDKDSFFSGGHAFKRGYFSYEQHGFGPVVYTEEEFFINLENILKNNGNPSEIYKSRIAQTFPFQDGKCCERVYFAIQNLTTLYSYTEKA